MSSLPAILDFHRRPRPVVLAAVLLLAACGGGAGGGNGGTAPAEVASAATVFEMAAGPLPGQAGQALAVPQFHVAPVVLEAPDGSDELDNAASASRAPRTTFIPEANRAFDTRRLTLASIRDRSAASGPAAALKPSAATTYTPAQIRAAYGLPALPAIGSAPSAAQAAQLGAGQTIYLIDANDDPNVAAELAAFNKSFGLPTCTSRAIAVNTALPLAAASPNACEFSVVYASSSGTMAGKAPAYDAGWATEITLDVQWAHATAPLARLILVEATDASLNGLLGAINLANAMGPGVVSMSFGGSEGSYTSSVDPSFSAPNMSYLAATGDAGAGVQWPAVSTHVLGVGGTSLTYTGSGPRAESAWAGSGGGVSQYTAVPGYQSNAVPGMGSQRFRNVADVSFNADPNTGQYVAVMAPGSSTASWLSVGGTSLATPQWAGLIALANALRAQGGKGPLGAPHGALYTQVAAVPGTYASDIADITTGADGSCSGCAAKPGYDTPTGIGTPNASKLAATLSGAALPPAAPVVASAQINGTVGTALSFTAAVTATDPVTLTLAGAPGGMTIAGTGVVKWATPVAGTYKVTVVATDSKTKLSGQGLYTVVIAAPPAPVVASATVSIKAGVALSYAVAVASPDAVTWALGGAPSGMSISTSGVLSWAAPRVGSYRVTVTAKDSKTGLCGQGVVTVNIASTTVAAPTIGASPMTGVAGKALSATISFADPGAAGFGVQIAGAPLGMSFSPSGMALVAQWPNPVTGSYALSIQLVDSNGLTAQATVPITITAH